MALIRWDKSWSVGDELIDAQHKQLIFLLNCLHDAMRQGKGHFVVLGTLEELIKYSTYHFQAEERLLARFGDEETAEHRAEHRAFIVRMQELKAKCEQSTAAVSVEVLAFLKEWAEHHVRVSDKELLKRLQTAV